MIDGRPMVESSSVLPAGQLFCPGLDETFGESTEEGRTERTTPMLVFRPADVAGSYVEMAYPSDVVEFSTEQVERQRLESRFRLLCQHLEKGVIRRLRVSAWFVERDADFQGAKQLFQQLVESAPPLTPRASGPSLSGKEQRPRRSAAVTICRCASASA